MKIIYIAYLFLLLSLSSCGKESDYSIVRNISMSKSERMPIGYKERGQGLHLMIDDFRPINDGSPQMGSYPVYGYLVVGKSGIIQIKNNFLIESGNYKLSLEQGEDGYCSIAIIKIDK
jgi:hypothetical protein